MTLSLPSNGFLIFVGAVFLACTNSSLTATLGILIGREREGEVDLLPHRVRGGSLLVRSSMDHCLKWNSERLTTLRLEQLSEFHSLPDGFRGGLGVLGFDKLFEFGELM